MESTAGLLKELFALTVIMGMTTHVKQFLDDLDKESFTRNDIADALLYAADEMQGIMTRARKDADEFMNKMEKSKDEDNNSDLSIDKDGNIKKS